MKKAKVPSSVPDKQRILVVDDQSDFRRLYSIALAEYFTVEEASSALMAMEMIVNEKPDAVVLDIRMPGKMSGLDLCRDIKQNTNFQDIKIVIVSGSDEVFDRTLGERFGSDDFLAKPISPSVLLDCLKRHLSSKYTQQVV